MTWRACQLRFKIGVRRRRHTNLTCSKNSESAPHAAKWTREKETLAKELTAHLIPLMSGGANALLYCDVQLIVFFDGRQVIVSRVEVFSVSLRRFQK